MMKLSQQLNLMGRINIRTFINHPHKGIRGVFLTPDQSINRSIAWSIDIYGWPRTYLGILPLPVCFFGYVASVNNLPQTHAISWAWIKWNFENKLKTDFLHNGAVTNFTDNSKYTRVTKWKSFPNCTTVKSENYTYTYEIPCSIEDNPGEYYYPIQTNKSKIIYMQYAKLAKSKKNVVFCGRTGLFKYIDMIPAIMIHLKLAENYLKFRN